MEPFYQIGNEETQLSLKHLVKELKSLKIWKKQESILKEKERA